MNHQHIARLALTGLCATQGLAQLAIDLNRTHATNRDWPGHARFHLVWQTLVIAILSGFEILLLWSHAVEPRSGFYAAIALAAVSPAAFLMAFAARRLYGGKLSDANGIPPLTIKLGPKVLQVDLNLVAVVGALFVLAAIVLLYRA